MPFDGFNPAAPLGEPASSKLFAATTVALTPTVINCSVGVRIREGLVAHVADALNINCYVGERIREGQTADVLIPTLIQCSVGERIRAGLPLQDTAVILKITISYLGTYDKIPVFDKGDTIRIYADFTNQVSGSPVDPGSVSFRLRKPGNVIVTNTPVTTPSSGRRQVDLQLDAEGAWRFRWETTGGREEGMFVVRHTAMD